MGEGSYGLGSLAEGEREGAGPAGAAASPLYKRPASRPLDHGAKSLSRRVSGARAPHSGVRDGGGRVGYRTGELSARFGWSGGSTCHAIPSH